MAEVEPRPGQCLDVVDEGRPEEVAQALLRVHEHLSPEREGAAPRAEQHEAAPLPLQRLQREGDARGLEHEPLLHLVADREVGDQHRQRRPELHDPHVGVDDQVEREGGRQQRGAQPVLAGAGDPGVGRGAVRSDLCCGPHVSAPTATGSAARARGA